MRCGSPSFVVGLGPRLGLALGICLLSGRAGAEEKDYRPPFSSEDGQVQQAPSIGEEPGALAGEPRDMDWIGFQQFQDVSRVFVRTTEPVKYSVDRSRPDMVTLVLHNTGISIRNNANHLDTRYFDSPVYFVQPTVIEGPSPSVRVEIRLRRQVQYTESQSDTTLVLVFPRG